MSLRTDGLIEELRGAIADSNKSYLDETIESRREIERLRKLETSLRQEIKELENTLSCSYQMATMNENNKLKAKILELEEDVKQLAQRSNKAELEVAGLNILKEKLEKGIECLKQKPENMQFCTLLQHYKDLKKELKDTKDHIQFEKDNTLHAIREVLGARSNRTEPGMSSHETALNAAKRVMEELTDYKAERNIAKKLRELTGAETTTTALKIVKDWGDLKLTVHNKACIAGANTSDLKDFVSNQFLPGKKVVLSGASYRQLMQDSEDLKVIKQKLGLTD